MRRRTVVVASILIALTPIPAPADETKLTAAEIFDLLTGATIAGDWNGTRYTQSFSADGHTLYAPSGGRPDAGRWRIARDADAYESHWRNSGWSRYEIVRDGSTLFWRDNRGRLYPFEVTSAR